MKNFGMVLLLIFVFSISLAFAACTDDDGGKVPTVSGKTRWGTPTITKLDSCADKSTVTEWYCAVSKAAGMEAVGNSVNMSCGQGYECKAGACVEKPPEITCTETDSGNDVYAQGTTTLETEGKKTQSETDYCSDSTHIKEYYCDGTELKVNHQHGLLCPSGYSCLDGACVVAKGDCSDSDGTSITAKGTVTWTATWGNDLIGYHQQQFSISDECADENNVNEAVCDPATGIGVYDKKACASGFACVDGACAQIVRICADSDKGANNPHSLGGIVYSYRIGSGAAVSGNHLDSCSPDSSKVFEWYCSPSNEPVQVEVPCTGGRCIDGVCVDYQCEATDDIYSPGGVVLNYPDPQDPESETNKCLNGNTLRVWSCGTDLSGNPKAVSQEIKCPDGGSCEANACVKVEQDLPIKPGAQLGSTYSENIVLSAIQSSGFELVRDWKALVALLIMLTMLLFIIAYMAGRAFDMPDLKAWAAVEINQLFITVAIVAILFASLVFFDTLLADSLKDAQLPDPANPGQILACDASNIADGSSCAITVASAYTDDMEVLMKKDIGDWLAAAAEAGKEMGRRSGISGTTYIYPLPTLWASFSVAWQPEKILDVERYNAVINFYMPMLSSILAQKYFVGSVVPALAPTILILGIVARSFFITRRLGGLLIAMAVGVMFVLPMMYIFNWLSLNIAIYGESAAASGSQALCPEECQQLPPVAYQTLVNTPFGDINEKYYTLEDWKNAIEKKFGKESEIGCYLQAMFNSRNYYVLDVAHSPYLPDSINSFEQLRILSTYGYKADVFFGCDHDEYGIADSRNFDLEEDFTPCYPQDGDDFKIPNPDYFDGFYADKYAYCPPTCREAPYPYTKTECISPAVQYACSMLPKSCIVEKLMPSNAYSLLDEADQSKVDKCSAECKMIPALKSNCNGQALIQPSDFLITSSSMTCSQFTKNQMNALENIFISFEEFDYFMVNGVPKQCRNWQVVDYLVDSNGMQASDPDNAVNKDALGNPVSYFVDSSGNALSNPPEYSIPASYGSSSISFSKRAVNEFCDPEAPSPLLTDDDISNFMSLIRMQCEQDFDKTFLSMRFAGMGNYYSGSCSINGFCLMRDPVCTDAPPSCRMRMLSLDRSEVLPWDEDDGWIPGGDCPDYIETECATPADVGSAEIAARQSCVFLVPNAQYWENCADCLFINKGFTFDPPLPKDCEALCSSSKWQKKITPAQFAVKTREGMIGRPEIKNAASFVIPAYILPILNILVTIMFIKSFSQLLGGDIEIPGLQKVF